MRAIDGDALIKKAYDEAKGMAEPYDDFGVLVEWLVDKAPPIEPEPKWIPVSERLPEERDSIFKKYYGTDKWLSSMFQTYSDNVIVTCEFVDGTRITETNNTCDGKWRTDQYPSRTVIAWMPLPEPYREEGEN